MHAQPQPGATHPVHPGSPSSLWTYAIPGGEKLESPDYHVTVTAGHDSRKSFVHFSEPLESYSLHNEQGGIVETRHTYHKGPLRTSQTTFSFTGAVTVRVRVLPGAKHISLPLRSVKILPSSYAIPCRIEGPDTIVFTLDRPEKIAVIPNYDEVWARFVQAAENHVPIKSWDVDFDEELKRGVLDEASFSASLAEGYDNPLIVSALPAETDLPDPAVSTILYVQPGDSVREETLLKYDVVWFKPGIHDLSAMGHSPFFHTRIKRGQTVYLEGGAYLYARFMRFHDAGAGPTTIRGRGIISGFKHHWIHSFSQASQLNDIDRVIGITLTDRAGFSIYNSRLIEDVTLMGAWHGNCDGPDYSDHTLIQNCFLLAHDDNLKVNHRTHARHIVIWQGTNAHSIMVKETFHSLPEFTDSLVEDIDVITYFQDPSRRKEPWARHGMGAIAAVTAMPITIRNFTFRDIRIESPYLYRIFNITNLDTNRINPGWFMTTSAKNHSRIRGLHFENITVSSPLLAYRSKIGSDYLDSLQNITFRNITINGVTVTRENKDTFFEIQEPHADQVSFLD